MTAPMTQGHRWWGALKHGGLLITPARLADHYPDALEPLPERTVERLRSDLNRLGGTQDVGAQAVRREAVRSWLDTTFQHVVGLGVPGRSESGRWTKGNDVAREHSVRLRDGTTLKPRQVWHGTPHGELPVFVNGDVPRLGVHRGRRFHARAVEWLRQRGLPIAVATNGRQLRLVHAGLDHEAFAEWDTEMWLEEGGPSDQVTALRVLLAPESLTAEGEREPSRLLAAIEASRKGQAELSQVLGERVRLAVEALIQAYGPALGELPREEVEPRAVYLAATRMVMRMVVVLFAEARDLLPRDHPIYHASYGLGGLREQLDRTGQGTGGRARLAHRRGAWPRVLGLFRLLYEGSAHQALPVPRYGGGLFEPAHVRPEDPIHRALAVMEDPAQGACPNDAVVADLLDLLTRTRTKVRQGRGNTWVTTPVDFGDLSTEYIGILYEGLLDFELRRVDDDPMVFLAIGDEPALPLSRLEQMPDKAVKDLVETFQKAASVTVDDEEDAVEAATEEPADDAAPEAPDSPEPGETPEESEADDAHRQAADRARAWARRAVELGKLVRKPRKKGGDAQRAYQDKVDRLARQLTRRVVLPGEWYLVRYGGTRKGSGTFYTRPALAVPTVQRTLQPLAYVPPVLDDGTPDDEAPARAWTPRRPEEILALKVCDPACGSGSFLVASLRALTEALLQSLYAHGRIAAQGDDRTLVTLAEGKVSEGRLSEEILPCRPDADDFDDRLRARLKRYVVERCIYGVDFDPLAVELCRLALWVETLDRDLPFHFLDHKIKCGNSLVGTWFDRFAHYPALAFEREGGDKSHKGVHFEKGAWTKAIKEFRNKRLKPDLVKFIRAERDLFDTSDDRTAEQVHDTALQTLRRMHELPVQEVEARAELYQQALEGDPAWQELRRAFDTWCALWFWPADRLDDAPLPTGFAQPSDAALAEVERLRAEHRFFHWELEFPDVFVAEGAGFDAVVGNPPWETLQPVSKEYFSNIDPLYRAYGKQEALDHQQRYFEEVAGEERRWLLYNAFFKAMAHYTKSAASPFGDEADGGARFSFGRGGATDELHAAWAGRRVGSRGYADPQHPFRLQGSGKPYTYKLFLEQSLQLMRDGGRFGLIVPSGIYTDQGATSLRTAFLEEHAWRWLFGFENRDKIFDIDSRFKFCPVIVEKGGRSARIRAAFMRRDVTDWADAEAHTLDVDVEQIRRFSPNTLAVLELSQRRDLEILEKIYANSVLLGDDSEDGWQIQYAQGDFNMTSDSKLFPPRPKWEEKGYRGDEYGRWLLGPWRKREKGTPAEPGLKRWEIEPGVILSQDGEMWIRKGEIEDVALPLYEGRMIGQFDFSAKGWVSGKGRSAVWREVSWLEKTVEPQYLMGYKVARERLGRDPWGDCKLAFMDVTSATNTRTMHSVPLAGSVCGHTAPVLRSASSFGMPQRIIELSGVLNSFAADSQFRQRVAGLHLSWAYMVEVAVPWPGTRLGRLVALLTLLLSGAAASHAPYWRGLQSLCEHYGIRPFVDVIRGGAQRRQAMGFLNALAARLYGLSADELRFILRGCDVGRESECNGELDPKGFWRVDASLPCEERTTTYAVHYADVMKSMTDAEVEELFGSIWAGKGIEDANDSGVCHDPVVSRGWHDGWEVIGYLEGELAGPPASIR